jgi:hypothetical protein
MMFVGRSVDMTAWQGTARRAAIAIGVAIVAVVASIADVSAQGAAGAPSAASSRPIALIDASGNAAGKPFNETMVLVTLGDAVVAPAVIRPDPRCGRARSIGPRDLALRRKRSLYLADCSTGALVHTSPHAGIRAASQVQTARGIVLFAGAIGPSITESVQSILYDTGCASVKVRQNGLVPVVMTVNLTTTYPPPLSFQ